MVKSARLQSASQSMVNSYVEWALPCKSAQLCFLYAFSMQNSVGSASCSQEEHLSCLHLPVGCLSMVYRNGMCNDLIFFHKGNMFLKWTCSLLAYCRLGFGSGATLALQAHAQLLQLLQEAAVQRVEWVLRSLALTQPAGSSSSSHSSLTSSSTSSCRALAGAKASRNAALGPSKQRIASKGESLLAVAEAACMASKDFISTLHQLNNDIPGLPLELVLQRLEKVEKAVAMEGLRRGQSLLQQLQLGELPVKELGAKSVASVTSRGESSSSSGIGAEDWDGTVSRGGGLEEPAWKLGKGLSEDFVTYHLNAQCGDLVWKACAKDQQEGKGTGGRLGSSKVQQKGPHWFAGYKPVAALLRQVQQVAGLPHRIVSELFSLEKAEAAAAAHGLDAVGVAGERVAKKARVQLWQLLVLSKTQVLLQCLQVWQLHPKPDAAVKQQQQEQAGGWGLGGGPGWNVLKQLISQLEQNQQLQQRDRGEQQRQSHHKLLQACWREEAEQLLEKVLHERHLTEDELAWRAAAVACPGELLRGAAAMWAEVQLLLELVPLLWPRGLLPVSALLLVTSSQVASKGLLPALAWFKCCHWVVLDGLSLFAADREGGADVMWKEELKSQRAVFRRKAAERWRALHADANAVQLLTNRVNLEAGDDAGFLELSAKREQWFGTWRCDNARAMAPMRMWKQRDEPWVGSSGSGSSEQPWDPSDDSEFDVACTDLQCSLAEDLRVIMEDMVSLLYVLEEEYQARYPGYLKAQQQGRGLRDKGGWNGAKEPFQQQEGLRSLLKVTAGLMQNPRAVAPKQSPEEEAYLEAVKLLRCKLLVPASAPEGDSMGGGGVAGRREELMNAAAAVEEATGRVMAARVADAADGKKKSQGPALEVTIQGLVDGMVAQAKVQAALLAGTATQADVRTAELAGAAASMAGGNMGREAAEVRMQGNSAALAKSASRSTGSSWYEDYVRVAVLLERLADVSSLPEAVYTAACALQHAEETADVAAYADSGSLERIYCALMKQLVLHRAGDLLDLLQQQQQQQCSHQQRQPHGEDEGVMKQLTVHLTANCDKCRARAAQQLTEHQGVYEGWWRERAMAITERLLHCKVWGVSACWDAACHTLGPSGPNELPELGRLWAEGLNLLSLVPLLWADQVPLLARMLRVAVELFGMGPGPAFVTLLEDGIAAAAACKGSIASGNAAGCRGSGDQLQQQAGGRGSKCPVQAPLGGRPSSCKQQEQLAAAAHPAIFSVLASIGTLLEKRVRQKLPVSELPLRAELLAQAAAAGVPKDALPVTLLEHWKAKEPMAATGAAAASADRGGGGGINNRGRGNECWEPSGDAVFMEGYTHLSQQLAAKVVELVGAVLLQFTQLEALELAPEHELDEKEVQRFRQLMSSVMIQTAQVLQERAALGGLGRGEGEIRGRGLLEFLQIGKISGESGETGDGVSKGKQQPQQPQLEDEEGGGGAVARGSDLDAAAAAAVSAKSSARWECTGEAGFHGAGLKRGLLVGSQGVSAAAGPDSTQRQQRQHTVQSSKSMVGSEWYANSYKPVAAFLTRWLEKRPSPQGWLRLEVLTLIHAEQKVEAAAAGGVDPDPVLVQLLQLWVLSESAQLLESIVLWGKQLQDKWQQQQDELQQQGTEPEAARASAAAYEAQLKVSEQVCKLVYANHKRCSSAGAYQQLQDNRRMYQQWWEKQSQAVFEVLLLASMVKASAAHSQGACDVAQHLAILVPLLWPDDQLPLRVVLLLAYCKLASEEVIAAGKYLAWHWAVVIEGLQRAGVALNVPLAGGVGGAAVAGEFPLVLSKAVLLLQQFDLACGAVGLMHDRMAGSQEALATRDVVFCHAKEQGSSVGTAAVQLVALWREREPAAAATAELLIAAGASSNAARTAAAASKDSGDGTPSAGGSCSASASGPLKGSGGKRGRDVSSMGVFWDPCADTELLNAYQLAEHELSELLRALLYCLSMLLPVIESGEVEKQPEQQGLSTVSSSSSGHSSSSHGSRVKGSSSDRRVTKASSGVGASAAAVATTQAPNCKSECRNREDPGVMLRKSRSSSSSSGEDFAAVRHNATLSLSPRAGSTGTGAAWDLGRTQEFADQLLNLLAHTAVSGLLDRQSVPGGDLQLITKMAGGVLDLARMWQLAGADPAWRVLQGVAGLSANDKDSMHGGGTAAVSHHLSTMLEGVPSMNAEEQLRVEEDAEFWDELFGYREGCDVEVREGELGQLDALIYSMLELYWSFPSSTRQKLTRDQQGSQEYSTEAQQDTLLARTNSSGSSASSNSGSSSGTSYSGSAYTGCGVLNVMGSSGPGAGCSGVEEDKWTEDAARQQQRLRKQQRSRIQLWGEQHLQLRKEQQHISADAGCLAASSSDGEGGRDDALGRGEKWNVSKGWGRDRSRMSIEGFGRDEGLSGFWRAHDLADTDEGEDDDGADAFVELRSPSQWPVSSADEDVHSGSHRKPCSSKAGAAKVARHEFMDQGEASSGFDDEAKRLCMERISSSSSSTLNRPLQLRQQQHQQEKQQQNQGQTEQRQQQQHFATGHGAPSGSAAAAAAAAGAGSSTFNSGGSPLGIGCASKGCQSGSQHVCRLHSDQQESTGKGAAAGAGQGVSRTFDHAAAVAQHLLVVWRAVVKLKEGLANTDRFDECFREQQQRKQQLIASGAAKDKCRAASELAAAYLDSRDQEWREVVRSLMALALARSHLRESLGPVASNVPVMSYDQELQLLDEVFRHLEDEVAGSSKRRRGSDSEGSTRSSSGISSSSSTVSYVNGSDYEENSSNDMACAQSSSSSDGDGLEESSSSARQDEARGGCEERTCKLDYQSSWEWGPQHQGVKWKWTGVGVLELEDDTCDVVLGPLGAAMPELLLKGLTAADSSQLPEVLKEVLKEKWEPQWWKRKRINPKMEQMVREEVLLGTEQLKSCELAALQLLLRAGLLEETWGVSAPAGDDESPWQTAEVPVGLKSLLEKLSELPFQTREKVGCRVLYWYAAWYFGVEPLILHSITLESYEYCNG